MHPNILLVLAASLAAASELARLVPQDFSKRATLSAGGWAVTNEGICPKGAATCGAFCCPGGLPCVHTSGGVRSNACCRNDGSEDCVSQLEASPVCADNTWSLFNIVNGPYDAGKGYFCCQPGQIGLNNGKCVGKGAATATATAAETVSQMAAPVASGPATNDASGSSATDAASTSLDLNQVGGATTVGAAVPTKSSGAVGDSVARDLGVLGVVGGALAMLLL